jgi:imidazoleglycerol-phosphate dehydratase
MRRASLHRQTGETKIDLDLDLDAGAAGADGISVPNGFFGHMLEALVKHSGVGLRIAAQGDIAVDLHHTVEDTGLVLGEALAEALGDRRGVTRFAHAYAPLDEALARAVIDLSGRGFFVWEVPPELEQVWVTREFPLTLVADFFQAFADRGRLTLHLSVLAGRKPHHVAEACFKAVAVALRQAIALRPGKGAGAASDIPSTKGTLVG